ncbi:hypothetical protein BXZ70DRAFT_911685 [Cristinia sonorae]|uniref:Uncharacterized protein n=1 Tax=Cristinia sonorae TaxID=1940300 RepID=A0A8K0XJX1_9AGAR|nr:hypothetical protein BXZ70DRAFT_911685 [Cristinia sonorae]
MLTSPPLSTVWYPLLKLLELFFWPTSLFCWPRNVCSWAGAEGYLWELRIMTVMLLLAMPFVFLARYQMEFAKSVPLEFERFPLLSFQFIDFITLEKSSNGQFFITRLLFTGEKGAEHLTLSMYLDVQHPSHRFFGYAPIKYHLWTEGATTILMDYCGNLAAIAQTDAQGTLRVYFTQELYLPFIGPLSQVYCIFPGGKEATISRCIEKILAFRDKLAISYSFFQTFIVALKEKEAPLGIEVLRRDSAGALLIEDAWRAQISASACAVLLARSQI